MKKPTKTTKKVKAWAILTVKTGNIYDLCITKPEPIPSRVSDIYKVVPVVITYSLDK